MEQIRKTLVMLYSLALKKEGVLSISVQNMYEEAIGKIDNMPEEPIPLLPIYKNDTNSIKWFMELALKMRDRGYSDGSIYSIDIDAWNELRENGYIPSQAIREDESNG